MSIRIATLVLAVAVFLPWLPACGDPEAEHPRSRRDDLTGEVLYQVTVPEFSPDGTLLGVVPHLGELRDLGIRVLVLNPIHPAGRTPDGSAAHPYAVRDHLAIDPALGTPADFAQLVDAAHRHGQVIILDMVLNHGATDHALWQRQPELFTRDADGRPTRKVESWRNIVDFDHTHRGTRQYLDRVLDTWVARGCDGFRFLHANLQDGDFWRQTIAGLRDRHPDLYLVADSVDRRHLGEGFDAVLNPFYLSGASFAYIDDVAQPGLNNDMWLAVVDSVVGDRHRGVTFLEDRFSKRVATIFPWPRGAGYVAGLLTLPGHPQLYNGQEWGASQPAQLHGGSPLDRTARHPDWDNHYRELLRLRSISPAVRLGESQRVPARGGDLLVYTRQHEDELVLVAINLSSDAPRFTLPADLAARQWRPWQDGAFVAAATALPGEVRLEPCGWLAWRASP